MENNWKDELFNLTILEFLRTKGFSKVNKHAFEILKSIMVQKNEELMIKVKKYAEMNQRHEINIFDVINVLENNNINIEDLTQKIEINNQKFQNSKKIISKVVKELCHEDDLEEKRYEAEIVSKPNIKKVKLTSSFPMSFLQNSKDREKLLVMNLPDKMILKETMDFESEDINNSKIKDFRIDEKRNYELENCKIRAFDNNKEININGIDKKIEEDKKKEDLQIKLTKLKKGGENVFEEESEIVDNLNVFEISNTQLF